MTVFAVQVKKPRQSKIAWVSFIFLKSYNKLLPFLKMTSMMAVVSRVILGTTHSANNTMAIDKTAINIFLIL